MSIYVICLTANGGLPILTRKKGDCENLPFSTMASLNGFHMFFKSLEIKLHTTYADNWTYTWRDFNNTMTIIVCSTGVGGLDLLPEMVWGAFCLFISRDEMAHPSLPDKLKKESKHYLPIIDAILEASISQFLGFSNCLLTTENAHILQRLNNDFSGQCGSLYCCLLVGQRVAVGTDGWWDLHIVDRQLLLFLLQTSSTLQNDIAVYLPIKSPNVAYRFITIPVSANNVCCTLCGSDPPLKNLLDLAENVFRSESTVLQKMERYIPCGTIDFELDPSIIAVIIANTVSRKCAFSSNIHHRTSAKLFMGDFQSMDAVRSLFDQTLSNSTFLNNNSTSNRVCEVTDQYWSSDSHKFYAQKDANSNVLCLLFIASIPTHTMKYMGKSLFSKLLNEKSFCW